MSEEIKQSNCTLREMNCELNQLSVPDGSAMFMQGDTTVVVGIYGPVEAKLQKMLYDKASVDVTYVPITGPGKVDHRVMELYIKEMCEAALLLTLHPSTSICINVQELQDFGELLACTLNGVCLALINSGLSMRFTVAAVSCMIKEETGEIVIDPTNVQSEGANAKLTFAFDSIKKDIVCCHTEGRFTEEAFLEAMDKCRQASQFVFDFYRNIVKRYANKI